MSDKCFCHLGEYQVKDAVARQQIADLENKIAAGGGESGGNNEPSKLYLREIMISLGTSNYNDPQGEIRIKLLTTSEDAVFTYPRLEIMQNMIISVTGYVLLYDNPSNCYPVYRVVFDNTGGYEKMKIHYYVPDNSPRWEEVDYTGVWSTKITTIESGVLKL